MISIVITSYKEPKTIGRAIESFLNQDIPEKYELVVSAPDKETQEVIKQYEKKNKNIKLFKDPGKGKTYALNMVLPKLKGRILILTDGDTFVSKNSVKLLLEAFKDEKVGCVTGKPMSTNKRDNILGYWSHLLCYAAHKLREQRAKNHQFIECSGYLWAFRNKVISKIPRETAEDAIVPLLFLQREYIIKYVPGAEVYIRYPSNISEFLAQKKRTAHAHETLSKYADLEKIARMKSFSNELLGGLGLFKFPKNIREFFWTLFLFPIRLYTWASVFYEKIIKKQYRVDGWKQLATTKQ